MTMPIIAKPCRFAMIGITLILTEEQYAIEEYNLQLEYAHKTTEAAIEALELELTVENITAEERTKIVTQLYVLKAALIPSDYR